MACYHPLTAYQRSNGEVVFAERGEIYRTLSLPCGRCIGCRLERSRQWAVRCMHEASLNGANNAFITLTYDSAHMPYRGMLYYPDFQRFMKRLRAEILPFRARFFMCGEYGPKLERPHYHALIFGYSFLGDRKYWQTTASGKAVFVSDQLSSLWGRGFCSVGNVSFQSAAYVARYCMAKVTGVDASAHYTRVDADGIFQLPPEFNHMSLKPGIGRLWYEKYKNEVYAGRDYIVVNGQKMRPPRYYDGLYKETGDFDDIAFKREFDARSRYADNTDDRLLVKEVVTKARVRSLVRS